MPLRAWILGLVLVALAVSAPPAAAAPSAASVERAANELSERLVSPCCWRESLRSHPSPLADELRREIRTRIAAGERTGAIEADLIARYGPRIRAFSAGWDPRRTVGAVFLAAFAGILVGFVWWARRRRATAAPTAGVGAAATATDVRLEDALDDELAAYDG